MKLIYNYALIIIHFLEAKAIFIISIFLMGYCMAAFWDKHYEPQEISDFEKLKYYNGKLLKIENSNDGKSVNFYTENKNFILTINYPNCIHWSSIQKEINVGDFINFGALEEKEHVAFSPLISLIKANKEYISLDCINQTIRSEKKILPAFRSIGIYLASFFLIFYFLLGVFKSINKVKQWKK
jgi:hypothetical protein